MYLITLQCIMLIFGNSYTVNSVESPLFKRNPAPDGHRCGVCPTYFDKICAFDPTTNSTFIFDNHCIMDIYNCKQDTAFAPLPYDNCLYFGNFAYVHGYKYEDEDYREDFLTIHETKKNPDFI